MQANIILSKRKYPYLNLVRQDDNIFFTALSIRIIKDFRLQNHPTAKNFTEEVFEEFYEVINGAKLYQFWKRRPNAYFPNGWWMHRNAMFKSPPDADDTGLIYYVKDHTQEEANRYFEALRSFANTSSKINHNSRPAYRNKKIFSTWFGSGKMPIEFDLVVLINTFYAMEKYDYPMDQYYEDSIFFVKNELKARNYIKAPFYASPWYANPCVIYYQISRFIYFHPDHELSSLTRTLVAQLDTIRSKARKEYDHLLVDSAVMFLNAKIPKPDPSPILATETENYSFFLASMLALLPGKIAWKLARFRLFHLRFVSREYNQLLVVENLEMRKIRNL